MAACPPGQHSCNGACVPDAQACGNMCGPTFKLCDNKCVAISSLTPEVCDNRDNDCNGVVDDVPPLDCPANACTKNGKKVCNKNTGTIDDSACKPGPQPTNSMACGQVGGNKCDVCPQGTACMNGNCAVTNCPQGQRICMSRNKCIPDDELCDSQCSNDFQLCDNKCIAKDACCKSKNPNCCIDDAGCGKCQKCVNRACIPQVGEDLKNECPNATKADCNTGLCTGADTCGFRGNTEACGNNDAKATCSPDRGRSVDAPKCPGNSGVCPAAGTTHTCAAPGACTNGTCEPCTMPTVCSGSGCTECGNPCGGRGQACCEGVLCLSSITVRNVCAANVCVACGEPNQPPCIAP